MSWWSDQVLPRLVDRACRHPEVDRLRIPVCAGLHGEVVEVGFGSGLNAPHYPPAVSRVSAVEPSDLAWRLAGPRRDVSAVQVVRAGLDGQRLELPDDAFDCALSTFTLCTIPDLGAALRELRRVLRPDGALYFLEHGLAPDPGVVRWQRRLEPLQKRLAGGCHLTRPIARDLERAGFELLELDEGYEPSIPRPAGYLYRGVAAAAS